MWLELKRSRCLGKKKQDELMEFLRHIFGSYGVPSGEPKLVTTLKMMLITLGVYAGKKSLGHICLLASSLAQFIVMVVATSFVFSFCIQSQTRCYPVKTCSSLSIK